MARRRRRTITYLWIFGLAVLTISLIHWEQTALLYILATLGVTALLLVVALADLAHGDVANRVGGPDSSPKSGAADGLRS
jgi:hypothetical protein